MEYECILCGGEKCCKEKNSSSLSFECALFKIKYDMDPSILEDRDKEKLNKKKALIFEHIIRHKSSNAGKFRYVDGDVVSDEDKSSKDNSKDERIIRVNSTSFPKSFSERVDRTLLNLYQTIKDISSNIETHIPNAYFSTKKVIEENEAMKDLLCEMGYLRRDGNSNKISAEGWKRIDELLKHESESKQGFIAISFSKDAEKISKAIKTAISSRGYFPRLINEKEHNNQIVPEILYEIKKSKFLVMDLSIPNNGAYYEAGYAKGLGKEIILTCSEDVFHSKDKPHFDVIQNSMVIWKDEKDLITRLENRIEATII